METQKMVNYWSIDLCLKKAKRKPIAIDVGLCKGFRNDIYESSNILKNRWLTYKGYINGIYDKYIHNDIKGDEKGAIKRYIEYVDQINK